MSTGRQIFYVTNYHAVHYYCHAGKMIMSQVFDTQTESAGLEKIMQKAGDLPCHVVLDLIEEDYKRERIPHTLPHERRAVLTRKLKGMFRDTPYYYGKVQCREKTGRRDDRILATAIINPDLLTPLLDKLLAQKTPVTGVYSLPLFTGALVRELKCNKGNVLWISMQQHSGVRQSFFQDGHLQISRLSPVNDWNKTNLPQLLSKEIDKTRNYMNRLRLLSNEAPLNVCFLVGNTHETQLREHFSADEFVSYRFFNLHEQAKKLRIVAPEGEYSDAFYIHYLLKHKPANHYAATRHRYYHYLGKVGVAIKSTALLSALALLYMAGIYRIDALHAQAQDVLDRQHAVALSKRLQALRKTMPASVLNAKQTKAVVQISEHLQKLPVQPRILLEKIAMLLEHYERVRLDGIAWVADRDPDTGLSSKQRKRPGISAYQLMEQDDLKGIKQRYEILTLSGSIEPFDGDYRVAMTTLDRFLRQVQSLRGIKWTSRIKMPLNLAADANIVDELSGKAANKKAEFIIRIIYRPEV